jgi:hypothetical protein
MACNLSTTQPTPLPTPDLPRTEILAPANNARVVEGTEFEFDVVGRDDTLGIAKLELRIDETTVHEVMPTEGGAVPVFRATMNWLAAGVGLHVVEAVAYRPDGTTGDAALINIEVVPAQ